MRAGTTPSRIGGSLVALFAVLSAGASPVDAQTPPPPPDGSAPVPMTVRPTLTNTGDVMRALRAAYPARLRDAGIAGAPQVWIHIDVQGAVDDSRIQESSGYQELDEAALRVARAMLFTPARNGDQTVAVWVMIPVRFAVER